MPNVIASGLGGQFGVAEETVYGTGVTPTRFYEFNSEGLAVDVGKVESNAIGTGRFQRSDRVKTYIKSAKGPVAIPVLNKGAGLLFKHMLGGVATTGAGANKTHTFTPDAVALQGKSLTAQAGRPDITGVSRPFTYLGGKVTDWELAAEVDKGLIVTPTFDFKTALTATALAAASYPAAQEMFIFTEGALTIGGTAQAVRAASIKGANALNVDRRFIGAANKKEPLANAIAEITGQLDCEFEDLTRYAAWVAGTTAALVLTFTLATLIPTTSTPYSLTITLPAIEYSGDTPMIGGPDVVKQASPFRALNNGTDPIISLAYVTDDTAP